MLKKIKLSELKPNPYRHFMTYEIQESKVEALTESMKATGFWSTTLLSRKAEDGYELAFGHHRWQAALKVYGKDAEFDITVEKLDNDRMLQMMARENNEVYDANALQDIELVKAAIEGYANGEIHLPPAKRPKHGGASGLSVSDYLTDLESTQSPLKFTAKGLAEYLGTLQWRINQALGHLRLLKEGLAEVDDFKGLSPTQGQELKTQIKEAESVVTKKRGKKSGKEAARKVAKEGGKALREKEATSGRGSGSTIKKTIKNVASDVIQEAIGMNTDLEKFRRRFVSTRDKINTAALSLQSLVDEMLDMGVTDISGLSEVRDMNQSVQKMEEAINMLRANYGAKPELKVIGHE